MLDTLICARRSVQGSATARDNSPWYDALSRRPDRLRGVRVEDSDIRRKNCGGVE